MANTTIDQLQLDIIVNNKGVVRQIDSVNKSLEKLNNTVASSGNLSNILGGATGGTKTGGTAKNISNISKTLNFGKILGKLYFIRNYTKQLGSAIAGVVQRAMDYVETQNLWQVANRENISEAREFIDIMNKAYGVSTKTLMNYQAIFKNMLSALGGISDIVSTTLSQQLTQFALDFASLYNVSIESAMTKFQAVLSGQVRPIRSKSGYDITETTIFDIYKQMGGEKTVRQLSQIEKRLLRIYAVFDQMSATGAVGDMAKTIETASNQTRIMNEQFQEMTMWLGQSVLMWMKQAKILQNVNALLITMKEIFKSIAYAGGYTEEDFLGGMFENVTETSEAIDELTGKLLSFDKFEALNSTDTTGSTIDPKIEELLGKITTQTSLAGFEAQKMAEEWLTSLGFIDENGDEILDITEKAQSLLDTIKNIGETFSIIFGIILAIKSPIIALISALGLLYSSDEDFRNTVNETGKILIKLFEDIMPPLIEIIKDLLPIINKVLKFIAVALYDIVFILSIIIKYLKNDFINDVVKVANIVADAFTSAWKGIANGFASVINWISNGFISFVNLMIDGINDILIPINAIAGLFGGSVKIEHWNAVVDWTPYPAYVTGGFPEDGMFFANSGEMVGGFSNGKTAVANNEQITTGIANAVYPAVYNAMIQASKQGSAKGYGNVYIDSK
ncbi:MAG: hypothetical protein EOL95_09490, partial [Bacteroidia bacterium]|nr:hypothetical protein [Bacteroidia bacterium]